MNWDAIGAVGEVVGAIAVILTLLYLAAQIRQNTTSLQGQTDMDYARETANWSARITANPELVELWLRGVRGEPLSESDSIRYCLLNSEWFYLCEGCYRQYRRGLLDEETWETLANSLATFLMQDQILKNWWESGASIMSQEFKEQINTRVGSERLTWNRKKNTEDLFERLSEVKRGAERLDD